jgi:hypothetical protein
MNTFFTRNDPETKDPSLREVFEDELFDEDYDDTLFDWDGDALASAGFGTDEDYGGWD